MAGNKVTKRNPLAIEMLERMRSETHAVHSEAAIIGCAMLYPNSGEDLVAAVVESDFWHPLHRLVFAAIRRVHMTGGSPAYPAVCTELGHDLATVGGPVGLEKITHCTPLDIDWHARKVREAARKRSALEAAAQCVGDNATIEEISMAFEKALCIEETRFVPKNLGDVAIRRLEIVESNLRDKKRLTGIPTGLSYLDILTGGLQPTDLILIAGRPGAGKTALLLELAIRAATYGYPVLFVSIEMGEDQVSDRATASHSGSSANSIRTGMATFETIYRLRESALAIKALPLQIIDAPGIRVRDIYKEAKRLPKRDGVVIVDYFQYIEPDDKRLPREQQVASIGKQLKKAAKATELPWVVAAQLKRIEGGKTDKTRNPKPELSDLRESGSMEQDADTVGLLWRADYGGNEVQGVPSDLELRISKQRNGSTGVVPLKFYRDTQRIEQGGF